MKSDKGGNMPISSRPLIVLLGGTNRHDSFTERAVIFTARIVESLGARCEIFGGRDLDLPMYAPELPYRTEGAIRLIGALRKADGIIIGGSGYHGAMSGMLKNALDYTEDMAKDEEPYFHGRVVGIIGTALTWQSVGTLLITLRSVVHALRGWPTPLGVAINTSTAPFDAAGNCTAPEVANQLNLLAKQVVEFSARRKKVTETLPLLFAKPDYTE
jgi:FMN reductase